MDPLDYTSFVLWSNLVFWMHQLASDGIIRPEMDRYTGFPDHSGDRVRHGSNIRESDVTLLLGGIRVSRGGGGLRAAGGVPR